MELRDVRVAWSQVSGPWRSALRMEQVDDVDIHGFVARQAPGPANAPAIHLTDVRRAFVHGCRAEAGTGTFLRADGAASAGVVVGDNNLTASGRPVDLQTIEPR